MTKEARNYLVDFIRRGQNIDMFYHDSRFPGHGDSKGKIEKETNRMRMIAGILKDDFGIDVFNFDDPDFSYEESDMLTFTDEDVDEASLWL